MGLTVEQVRSACEWQREVCRKNGSPSYVALITELIRQLGVDDGITQLLTGDSRDPIQSAQCLRLFGAVNRIAMAESASWITAYYPTLGGNLDLDRLVPAFYDFLRANLATVREEMSAGVQTNEVGRAAPLSAAMNYVANATGLPLRLLEVGSSAGLNLLLDRYYVAAGDESWGPADSALRLVGHFESGAPRAATLVVTERRGCDLNPIDVHAPDAGDLLRSFVWPEHVERARRLNAALDIARSAPRLLIDASDACSWILRHLEISTPGQTTVVYHSIVLPYFDPGERARFTRIIRSCGEATDENRPLAWISLEPSDQDYSVVDLTCELWPGHQRILLARTTPHGTRVRWKPQTQPT